MKWLTYISEWFGKLLKPTEREKAVLGYYKTSSNYCVELYYLKSGKTISETSQSLMKAAERIRPSLREVELTHVVSGAVEDVYLTKQSLEQIADNLERVFDSKPKREHVSADARFILMLYLGIRDTNVEYRSQTA